MSVSKFRFVSPGVFVNEIDNSQLPVLPAAMGPVIIGRSLRGPIMRPVQIQSYSDFVEVFGEPVAGSQVGDVWREGNRLGVTYGAYAAQAYLRNSNPVTFIRLGGFQNDNADTDGKAGWDYGDAYGLFVMDISQSSNNIYVTNGTASAALAAVIYSEDAVGLSGLPLSGTTELSNVIGNWVRADGNNLQFRVHPSQNETASVNFVENQKRYIRSVLNTNPVATNTSLATERKRYFLGDTYLTWVKENLNNYTDSNVAGIIVKLVSGSVKFANHKQGATTAESGWVVSQDVGLSASFSADSTGEYPVQKLFRVKALSEGEWNSQNLKVVIEDVKESPNVFYKYGTFTLAIRKLDDNDNAPVYVERFTGLSLDANSPSYIAKRIGDKYSVWDYSKKAFVEYGTYNNLSKFIRVELNTDLETGLLDQSLLPFGFYGPLQYNVSPRAGASGSNVQAFGFVATAVTGNSPYTASFVLPKIPLLETSQDSLSPSLSDVYWGLKTNLESTRRFNEDVRDLLKEKHVSFPTTATAASKYSFMFSLDDVKLTGSSNQYAVWAEGNRASGSSLTAVSSSYSLSDAVLNRFNKFVLPLVGGSDGVDVTEKDPFCKRKLPTSATETNNYAYNSVKVAVESVADPEVVEMNLLTAPGIENKNLTSLMVQKCEARGDALAIIDLEGDYNPETPRSKPLVSTVVSNLKDRSINSSYGCAFFPWVLAQDTATGNKVWLPPSIAALGTFSSAQRSTELWFAPAGFNRGGLSNGAAGIPVLQTALRLTSKDRDALYDANINPIATFPAEGIVIFGQKTLQVTPSALDRINVRRLMIYLKKEISRMARTVLFDPNIQVTWKRFTNQAVPFLDSVKSRFGLSDFKVVLDETTTTPELVDRNIVYAKILLKPTRAIEFIALDFVILPTGAAFTD